MGVFSDYLDSLKKEGEAFAQFFQHPSTGSATHLTAETIQTPLRLAHDTGSYAAGNAVDTAKATVDTMLQALALGQKYVTRPGLGYLAQHGIDPATLSPVFVRPDTKHLSGSVLGDLATILKHPTHVTYQQELNALDPSDPRRNKILAKKANAKLADSYTGAYNAALEGDPLNRIALETIYDPINIATLGSGEAVTVPLKAGLEGLGVAKKAEAGSRLASLAMKSPGTYEIANKAFNKALTLPIVAPFKGIKGGLRRLGWLDLSKAGEAAVEEQAPILGALGELTNALENEQGIIPQIILPDPRQSRKLGVLIPGLASREAEITPLLPKGYTWEPVVSGEDLIYEPIVPKKELGKLQRQLKKIVLPDTTPSGAATATNGSAATEDLVTQSAAPNGATVNGNGSAVGQTTTSSRFLDPSQRLQSTSETPPEFTSAVSGFLANEEIPGGLRREITQVRGGAPEYRVRFEATETPEGTFQVATKRNRITTNGSELTETTNRELQDASIPEGETYLTPEDALDAAESRYKDTIRNRFQTDQDIHAQRLDTALQEIQRLGGNVTPEQLATDFGWKTDYAKKVLIDLQQSGRIGKVPTSTVRRFQPLGKEVGQDGSLVTRFRWGDREYTSTLAPEGAGSRFTLTTADPNQGEVVIKQGSLPQPPQRLANQPLFSFNTLDQETAARLGAAPVETPVTPNGSAGEVPTNGSTPPTEPLAAAPSPPTNGNGSLPYTRIQYPPPTDPKEVLATVKAAIQGKGSVPLTPYLASVPDDVLTQADEQIQNVIAQTPGFKNTERAIRSRIFNEIERRTSPEAAQSADQVLYLINQRLNRGEHYWSIRGSLNNFNNDEILSGLNEAYRRSDPSYQTLQQEARRRGLIQVNPPPEIPETPPPPEPTRLNPEFFVSELPKAPKPIDPSVSQSVRNQLITIQRAAGVSPDKVDRVMSYIEPLLRDNPEHFLAQRLSGDSDLRSGILKAMQSGNEKTSRNILYDTFKQQDQLWSSLGVKSPVFNKYLGWLDDAKGPASTTIGEAKKYATAISDKNVDLLNYYADKYPKFGELLRNSQEAVNKAQGELDALRDMADQLAVANGAPPPGRKTGTLDDIRETIRRYGDEAQKQQWEKWLKDNYYPATDSAREIYLSKLTGTVHDEIQKLYKLSPAEQRRYSEAYNRFMGIMREQALMSVKYHAANIFDGASRSLLYGVDPTVGFSADKMAENYGIQIPDTISASFERTLLPEQEATFGGKETRLPGWQQIREQAKNTHTGKFPILGNLTGGLTGVPAAINHFLTLAVDGTFRKAAWATEFQRFVEKEVAPNLETVVKDLDPQHADAVIKEYRDAGWRLTQQEASSLAQKAGVGPDTADQISRLWGQGLNEASQSGVTFSNKINLVYTDERKIEEKLHLRSWLMFHSWATRNLPFYAETLAQNPWLLRAFNTYMNATEDERKRLGLSEAYRGKLPAGALALPTFLLGEQNRIWFNPMATFSIFDQTKSLGTNYDQDPNLLSQGMNLLGGVGLSPASYIPMALSILGYTGGAGDPQRFSRHSALIDSLTGFDPENDVVPFLDIQRYAKNQLSGRLPKSHFNPSYTESGNTSVDYATQKHLRELGLALTGNPQRFVTATPDMQIYQIAKQQAEKENRFRQLVGFVSPLPISVTTQKEEEIRQAQQALNQHLPQRPSASDTSPEAEMQRQLASAAYQQAIAARDPGTAYAGIAYGDYRKTQIEAGIQWLNRYGWPSGKPNGVQSAILADYPALADYLNWRASRPNSADTSIDTFLQSVR